MFHLYWYPLQCCYSPGQCLLHLLYCYSLVVVAAAVVVVAVVVAAAAVVDFVW